MTTVDERRAEMRRIGDRHPDVLRSTPRSSSCPPHAALLHRIASMITTEDLPAASVRVDALQRQVFIDASECELVENVVRQYAAALDLGPVTQVPYDGPNGMAATQWSTSGYDGTGVWWLVSGYQLLPTEMTDRFGVGVGPST